MKIDTRPLVSGSELAPQRSAHAAPVAPADPVVGLPPVREPGAPRNAVGHSLRGELEGLAHTGGVEPSLFCGSRPVQILEDILERILPSLDLEGETRTLAMALLREEIDTRQALDRQRVEVGE